MISLTYAMGRRYCGACRARTVNFSAANPKFGDRVHPGYSHRGAQDTDALTGEHSIKDVGELAIAISDQERELGRAIAEIHQQIPCLLGNPGTDGVRGDAQQKDEDQAALEIITNTRLTTDRHRHRPHGQCGCGTDLADARDVGIERSHQVHDLPEVHITVWQHDVYRVRCGCGAEHVAQLPDEVSAAPAGYGVNLKSLAVYLLIYQHVPVQRCVQLIADLTGGTGPSDGFVHGMLTRCATAVAEVVAAIKSLITLAHVVGFDETTLRCGEAGQKKYVLSASTENATAYHLGGRDLDSFAAFGILPAFAGVAVHDRYCNYFHTRWDKLAGHQACAAHLLRDFADAAESYPDGHWPAQATRALRGADYQVRRRPILGGLTSE
jgi:hypothetical protein